MATTLHIQSITEQILNKLYDYLSQDDEIPSIIVEELRQLGIAGKMTESAAILDAIALLEEDDHEAH